MTQELWNTERVRVEYGYASIRSVSSELSRLSVKPVSREAGREGQNLYDPDEVAAAFANRPGRGRRKASCTQSVPETINEGSAAGRGDKDEETT